MGKKAVYISGPITGVDRYWEPFEQAEDAIMAVGLVPLSPAHLPEGLEHAQYMKLDMEMVSVADCVLFLPGWEKSNGAKLEHAAAGVYGKPRFMLTNMADLHSIVDYMKEVLRHE